MENFQNKEIPILIESLATFLIEVADSPPLGLNLKTKEFSSLSESSFFGYKFEDKDRKGIWLGIYLDFWKQKGLPICIQIIADKGYPGGFILKFEQFCKSENEILCDYHNDFHDLPTVGIRNEFLMEKKRGEIIQMIERLLKKLLLT